MPLVHSNYLCSNDQPVPGIISMNHMGMRFQAVSSLQSMPGLSRDADLALPFLVECAESANCQTVLTIAHHPDEHANSRLADCAADRRHLAMTTLGCTWPNPVTWSGRSLLQMITAS